MAHARRKFVELHLNNKSTLAAATAIEFIDAEEQRPE